MMTDETRKTGAAAILEALKTMPLQPGVYRMLDEHGNVLYVGKANQLKKRVTSYTQPNRLSERIQRMVALTCSVEIVTTHTEAEALLLEANLIKNYAPRFNILLRDDKTYPWLIIGNENYPRIAKYRGKIQKGTFYWGPFASARAVDQTLNILQRVFGLRTCEDSVFLTRKRPCLLYQIKRCSGPCVERISYEDYQLSVKQAKAFLMGKAPEVQRFLVEKMQQASDNLDFEKAAALRDQIQALAYVQSNGVVNMVALQDADVIALYSAGGQSCVQVFFFRGGRNNGNRAFFPSYSFHDTPTDIEVLEFFLAQFYEDKIPPAQILLSHDLSQHTVLADALKLKAGSKVDLLFPQRGEKRAVVEHALTNAREALERKMAEQASQKQNLLRMKEVFHLPALPKRIEVYDNSHIMGTNPYGVMVVAGPEGFERSEYRKFSIKGAIAPGDDFAMMREVLHRRFGRMRKEKKESSASERPVGFSAHQERDEVEGKATTQGTAGQEETGQEESEKERTGMAVLPDILLIDGGVGQYSAVKTILEELAIEGVSLIAIAKGVDRNAGREWFHSEGQPPFQLPERDNLLYYLQRLRDEAHRFAITTHRSGRSKALIRSELDVIPGIGSSRKKALLNHFGSVRAIKQAGLQDLESVVGISHNMAHSIYGYFHPDWQENTRKK
ncbi:excinuclease ABC subunit UvrC [Entomobacter blattae]|uniref:UvrABC system protein C n=1 Tax=Entomobacter blattae TaxID=2762277 RepID=A0A7H1NSD5_9PROT|nr:excinuclease ABC subunit UvrC [Entomobacter blattae]QNT78695.1 UvrABC system protein C [Entomobacter blattae]